MSHRVFAGLLLISCVGLVAGARGQTITIDTHAAGTPFSPGVHGQATPAVNITRGDYQVGIPKALNVATGSSIRGVAGGLEAELFNWETRNNDARASTLQYLKYARDEQADLFITTNMRGVVGPDPNNPGKQVYTDTSIPTLATLAADQVRYTNRIAQIYRAGDTISDSRDQQVLGKLAWTTSTPGDNWPTLLSPGEAAVPKVTYWEIGNEPRVSVVNAYGVTNGYTFLTPNHAVDSTHKYDYRERYAAITSAMKAEDSTIKVGPCLVGATTTTERELLDSILKPQTNGSLLPVDFISYHPYQKMGDVAVTGNAADVSTFLNGIYDAQKTSLDTLKSAVSADGRNPNSIEYVASETNVSNWSYNDTPQEAQMAHALGSVETVFSFARLGLRAAHYWVWPAHRFDGTEYPSYKAFEKLRDDMGDTIVSTYSATDTRLYTTRDSKTGQIAVWGLNFNNDSDTTLNLSMQGLSGNEKIQLLTLGALNGKTSLFSSNLASDMGGPTHDVDWKTTDLTGTDLSHYALTLPSATVSVLLISPVPEPATAGSLLLFGGLIATRRRRF